MIEPVSDARRAPITPQLALRVAVLGGIALALFAVIFFRLWYLQVLSGDQYLQQARDNRVRDVRVQAPRGDVVDRNGDVLVENRAATVVTIDPERLGATERDSAATWGQQMGRRAARPKGSRGALIAVPPIPPELRRRFRSLGSVVGMSPQTIQDRVIRALAQVPYAGVPIKVNVNAPVRNYLAEHSDRFPGVSVERRYLRRYPHGSLAAQLFGSVGEISERELKLDKDVTQGTIIGKDGIEGAYDQYLRGTDGSTRITVDAFGRPKHVGDGRSPSSGRQLRTSLDLGLQQTGQNYLAKAIAQGPGTAGAFVALDPRDGTVLAMGSAPTFDPSVLSGPISQATADRLYGESGGAPLVNRAISGLYPTGSTFKPITALAGLSAGVVDPTTVIRDATGCITVGRNKQQFCNAGKKALGDVSLRSALSVSSDVYFYRLGEWLNPKPGQPLQRWARTLGVGRRTEVDLPGEARGLVPDARWRREINAAERECRRRKGLSLAATPAALSAAVAGGCARSDLREWQTGDEIGLAIGQGDLQATPLQMAVAYATIANGGRIVRPHLGLAVEDANGRLLQRIEPGTARRVKLDPTALDAVRDGLHEATLAGTSADVWKDWPQDRYPVFGKTGTAQRNGRGDQSWYIAYVPDRNRPIVIAATVEDGGFGAEAAAPVARTIISRWYDEPVKWVVGKSTDR